jgi:hypothetical protein
VSLFASLLYLVDIWRKGLFASHLSLCLGLMNLCRVVTKIDISQQTTQDYSVIINNPPHNCTDPEEYRKFFSRYGDVVFVTIALNNGDLLTTLAERKAAQGPSPLLFFLPHSDVRNCPRNDSQRGRGSKCSSRKNFSHHTRHNRRKTHLLPGDMISSLDLLIQIISPPLLCPPLNSALDSPQPSKEPLVILTS